ncbi:Uncharacterized protein HA466_0212490 [Hirschfeldia incana]|nr:Uncharacterized protein HA466_0212490 [Hirschfeldia incana]
MASSLCSAARLLPDALGFIPPTTKLASSSSIRDSRSRVHGFSSPRNRRMGGRASNQLRVVAMAPEEEKLTRRNPLDFPIEWERPKPGRRPDIFPKFSPMKTPLPPPMPYDPPAEDEEEEEEKKEEEEDNPDQEEEEEQPEKQP